MSELYEADPLLIEQSIESGVLTQCYAWRAHYAENYAHRFDDYYRI